MRRTTRLLAPPLLAALLLAGCTPSDPMPTPPPTSDAAPVFATDEEALAAAEEAYGKYLATVDAILADGGQNPERLEPLVAPAIYSSELEGYKDLASRGLRGVGESSATLQIQRYDASSLVAYVCEDISSTDVVDSSGTSVVKSGRPTLLPYEVTFDLADSLRILEKQRWDGGGVC